MLKNDTVLVWNPGTPGIVNHPVRICGVATTGVPVLGLTYIAELLEPIEGYAYTHVADLNVI